MPCLAIDYLRFSWERNMRVRGGGGRCIRVIGRVSGSFLFWPFPFNGRSDLRMQKLTTFIRSHAPTLKLQLNVCVCVRERERDVVKRGTSKHTWKKRHFLGKYFFHSAQVSEQFFFFLHLIEKALKLNSGRYLHYWNRVSRISKSLLRAALFNEWMSLPKKLYWICLY